jgi:Zn-dependent peptidase ImmA (M78 family)/rRNA maturation endonuclease Nob1
MRVSSNYIRPIIEALEVLEESDVTELPLDFLMIQKRFRNLFHIRSYASLMTATGQSRYACIRMLGSEDGATVLNGDNKYIIYYNENKSRPRIRFTIAHEIGHIFLGHLEEYGNPVLESDDVEEQLYEHLEREANCFARNLLCPAYHTAKLLEEHGLEMISGGINSWNRTKETELTKNLKNAFDAKILLKKAFGISNQAAEARLAFLGQDLGKYHHRSLDGGWLASARISIAAEWCCSYCGLPRELGAIHCPECGRRSFSFRVNKEGNRYSQIDMDGMGRPSRCIVCGNTVNSLHADWCKICGSPLSNPCTRDETHVNHSEAKFCQVCGKPTMFYLTSYHDRVMQSKASFTGGHQVIYECDIKYDRVTNRIIECPQCGNEDFGEEAGFCKICGFELFNWCNAEPAESYRGGDYNLYHHPNPPDARYCEVCGSPTIYFINGIIKDYQTVLGELEAIEGGFGDGVPF